ncbi:hypothetical protein THAR02_06890 [Trichoderma harzianum]|uniref:Uncharacterized protein n=1 Tax=Trichoderma harzianum TaxID=5544 RepID=A0A0F9X768_TRIHA|nr:hypothetical protein THAR02_06890 [Trichoderma harzianum]
MDHNGPRPPYLAADKERADFIFFVPFLSENFRQYLFYHFSGHEDGDSSLLECAIALNSLENAIAGYFFTSPDVLPKGIGNAWYDLAQKFESLLHGGRIKEMLENPEHEPRIAYDPVSDSLPHIRGWIQQRLTREHH